MLKIKKILSPIVPKDSFLKTDKKRFFNLFQDLYEQVLLMLDLFTLTQEKLVSGVNIKTINGNSLLGEGNLEIKGGERCSTDSIYNQDNTVSVKTTDKIEITGDVAMGNTTIREIDADAIAGGKIYNFGNLIVDLQKGAENDVKGVSRNALVIGRSNNVTGVQQALLMGNDNTITTTSTAFDLYTINLAPLIGYKNTLTLTQGIPNFPIIGSYNNISGSRGSSNLIGTKNKLASNNPFTNIYGQSNRDDAGQNNIIGYYNGVSSFGNGIYGNQNSVVGKFNSIFSVCRWRWSFRASGGANATTYSYTSEEDEVIIKEGLYIIYERGVGTPSKIISVDTENKTLTVDTTLSTTALNNVLIKVSNIIEGQGNITVGSGCLVKGSDQALLGGALSAIDNPQHSTTIGYCNDYTKKGRFVIADGNSNSDRHNAMLIDEAGNINFTPKPNAKLTYNSEEVAIKNDIPTKMSQLQNDAYDSVGFQIEYTDGTRELLQVKVEKIKESPIDESE